MKKNIGSQLALYPMPVTVIGAMNGEKVTWTLVAHVGIIGHDRVLVSLACSHFINRAIKKRRNYQLISLTRVFLNRQILQVPSLEKKKTNRICSHTK